MALIKLPDNGQQFELDDEIAGNDDLLKSALRPVYPEIANASIKRETKDGVMTVTVVKQAGTKGVADVQGSLGFAEALDRQEAVLLPLSSVTTDGGTQTRAMTSMDVAREYADAIQAGAVFPPVKVVQEGEVYWLYDGFHTTTAHLLAGRTEILALVRPGTRREAVLLAVGANQTHGLRRTNEDKRRAVGILLRDEEWRHWSDREIAERTGVSHTFVSNLRREIYPPRPAEGGNDLQMGAAGQERTYERGGQTVTFIPTPTAEDLKALGQQEFAAPHPGPEPEQEPEGEGEGEEGEEIEGTEEEMEGLPGEGVQMPPVTLPPVVRAPSPSPSPAPRPQPSPTASTPTPAPVPVAKPVPVSFDQAEITLTLILQPDDGKEGGRHVVLVGNCPGLPAPVYRLKRLSDFWPWQPEIEGVLALFRQALAPAPAPAQASSGAAPTSEEVEA